MTQNGVYKFKSIEIYISERRNAEILQKKTIQKLNKTKYNITFIRAVI
jgi:hypothetical protein